MRKKIKYIVLLLIIFLPYTQMANAFAISNNYVKMSDIGVIFEIVMSALILYLFFMGVKSCFHKSYKNYTNSLYQNGNRGYNIQSKENLMFDFETAKRVKNLMETKKRNGFKKNSTINEHLKAEDKISV